MPQRCVLKNDIGQGDYFTMPSGGCCTVRESARNGETRRNSLSPARRDNPALREKTGKEEPTKEKYDVRFSGRDLASFLANGDLHRPHLDEICVFALSQIRKSVTFHTARRERDGFVSFQ